MVGGVRIIDRVADALGSVASELILISNADDAPNWLPGVNVVADLRPERGSLVGIHTALTHARDTVLVVAWDMPFVNRALLQSIRDRSVTADFATVPDGPSGPEPFCAAYTTACLPFVDAALDAADFRLSHLLARLPSVDRIVAPELSGAGDPAHLFLNVNNAVDLAVAERLATGS